MPITPIPVRTPFLVVDNQGRFTGQVSWPWLKWLLEVQGVSPVDPNALLSLTIQETEPIANFEDVADQAALSSSLDTSPGRETLIEELAGGVSLALADIPRPPDVPAFGGMYIYNLAGGGPTITVAATDTYYMVDTGFTAMSSFELMEFANSRELVVLYDGVYKVIWSMSVECGVANQEIEGSLMLNGTEEVLASAHLELGIANRAQAFSAAWEGYLAQGDLIQLAVLNHTATNDITVDHANLVAHRISQLG